MIWEARLENLLMYEIHIYSIAIFRSTNVEASRIWRQQLKKEKWTMLIIIFKTGKINWLVITLEFGPRNSILNWANGIIEKYPEHSVIINTHSYMYSDSTRQGPGDNWRPQDYGVGKDQGDSAVNDGEQIWEKLVRIHPNIRFVFSGHVLNGVWVHW